MAALSIPPCLDPGQAKPIGNRHEQAYRAHLRRVHVELVTIRIVRPTLAELLRLRGDKADEYLTALAELKAERS